MRIVYLNPSGQLGGAERCLLDVMERIRAVEPSWSLSLVASREGPLLARASALGVDARVVPMPAELAALGDAGAGQRRAGVLGVGMRGMRALGCVRNYRRALGAELRELNPDVVHTNGNKMHVMGTWVRPRSASLVWHLHDYVMGRVFMTPAIRFCSRHCDLGVAVSRSVARDVGRAWHGRRSLRVVLNGVDIRRFAPQGPRVDLDALGGAAPPPPGTIRAGLVATMGRFKGQDVFLRAMAAIPREIPVRGYIVGGALYETRQSEWSVEALRALATELGVADRVVFTGFVDDAPGVMRALDVVVHATVGPEPFGLVIAEGMACGRAVITSGIGGAGEIVRPGEDALTHAPGDASALAEAITRLVTDGPLRERLGVAARRRAEEAFDRDRMGSALVPMYRELRAVAPHRGAGA